MARIPTNVITGFPGVGKTTAILDLLARSPQERWAVLVNESGEVSIDPANFAVPSNVTVREVGGGCVCCATAPILQVALHRLLAESDPSRLLIEAAGHPRRLLDLLRSSYAERLDVRATIALVAPADAIDPQMQENSIFREQVDLAEVLVLSKLDQAGPGAVAEFQRWANALVPLKLLIAATLKGRLDPAWLDLGSGRWTANQIEKTSHSI